MTAGGDRSIQGIAGEKAAAQFLRRKGMKVLRRNWKGRSGEIDLIVRDGDVLVFVEVKARSSERWGAPEDAVTPAKQIHLTSAATEFVARHRVRDRLLRFDVVSVLLTDEGPVIQHFTDAFPPRYAGKKR
jgi:putative endonuclease